MFACILTCTFAVMAVFSATGMAHTGPIPPDDPQCPQVTANLTEIWPANGRFVRITLTVPNATQDQIRIYKVTQDEPVEGLNRWDRGPDAIISDDKHSALVRAERSDDGDGRVYRIAFDVYDVAGEVKKCSFAVYVGVPLDKCSPDGPDAVNSGQDYNSRESSDESPPQGGSHGMAPYYKHGGFFKCGKPHVQKPPCRRAGHYGGPFKQHHHGRR
jgi:hypothetical protein